jgi:Phage integrase, N-terminal SAM-like domain
MSEKPISPLRQRMIEDMSVRNFVEKTRNDYIRQVKTFTAFLGHSPDTATPEDLRRFQLHQTQTGMRPPTMNSSAVEQAKNAPLDLLDHLVGERKQCCWQCNAKRPRGLEIDGEEKTRRQQHRQLGRFCALQNVARVDAGLRTSGP